MVPSPPVLFLSLAVALTLSAATEAPAQLLLAGGAGLHFPDVEVLSDVNPGPGAELSLRLGVGDRIRLGGGVQVNRHTVGESSDSYEVFVPFVECRFRLTGGSSRWAPFLGLRAGWLRSSVEVLGREVSGTGRLLGAVGGMTFRATTRLSVELSGLYYRGTVHDVELGDLPFSVDDLSADVVGVGMGVAWRIR